MADSILGGGPPSGHSTSSSDDSRPFFGFATGTTPDMPFSRYVTPDTPHGHRYRSRTGRLHAVKARYRAGDDWAILAGKDPNQLIDLQRRMIAIGALKPKGFTPGQADKPTRAALQDILARSNARGMRYGNYLDEALMDAQATGFDPYSSSASAPPPALVITHENPDSVKADFQSQSTNLLGSVMDDPAAFAQKYASQETLSQTADYNATYLNGPDSNTGAGGQVTKPADIAAQVIAAHPDAYKVNKLGQNAQSFINLLTQSYGAGQPGTG